MYSIEVTLNEHFTKKHTETKVILTNISNTTRELKVSSYAGLSSAQLEHISGFMSLCFQGTIQVAFHTSR